MPGRTRVSTDAVTKALVYRYVKEDDSEATIETAEAIQRIRALDGNAIDNVTRALRQQHPDDQPPEVVRAILAATDDCIRIIFRLADLDTEVEPHFRRVIPELACRLVSSPDIAVRKDASILTILDALVEETIGWAPDLGRAGDRILLNTRDVIGRLCDEETDIKSLQAEVDELVTKERTRIAKLEDRLAASETGRLRSSQSKTRSAEMINAAMAGRHMTYNIAAFLQGPWFDSVQLLVLREGLDSETWLRAAKLTETLVWTIQPLATDDESERQKLYRIIEHLPGEIRELLVALEHETDATEQVLAAIEAEHLAVVSGQPLEYEEFPGLPCDDEPAGRPRASRFLQRKVDAFNPGQWFTYESEGEFTRIKLVLKLDDVRELLFTNRNGMKVMQRSFDEFAYLLSSGIVKPLNHSAVFSSTFEAHYLGLIEEHEKFIQRQEHMKRDEEERETARRKALTEAAALARAREDAERERQVRARADRLAQARQIAELEENAGAVTELTRHVEALAIGAWLRLPGPDGELEECKLAVRISASDKMIFVSRAGTKIGEYNTEQLVQLLVAGQGEIQDAGVEFEDTLA
ncbi:MAG: DUF1631 family protein, partial [Pseudomonadales bacterium]|nr:DUF1631 family protein [Pseudomonadales bacterium]